MDGALYLNTGYCRTYTQYSLKVSADTLSRSIFLSGKIFSFTYEIISTSEERKFILNMTRLLITITPMVVKIVRIAAAN